MSPHGAGAGHPVANATATYQAYGLAIASPIPLDLPAGVGPPDVTVRFEKLRHIGPPLAWETGSAFAGGDARRVELRVPGLLAAEIRDGRCIALHPEDGADPALVGAFVLQPLLVVVLSQRGVPALHASGVFVGGRAVAFTGFSGEGKSTTAGALMRRGYTILCDDILPVQPDGTLLPGVVGLKLWPDTASALGHDPAMLPLVVGEAEKRHYYPADRSGLDLVPLSTVYVLEKGPPAITPLPPARALAELVRQTYCIRTIRHTGQQAWHFAQLTTLLRHVAVKRLSRPTDLGGLDTLAGLIEEDVWVGASW